MPHIHINLRLNTQVLNTQQRADQLFSRYFLVLFRLHPYYLLDEFQKKSANLSMNYSFWTCMRGILEYMPGPYKVTYHDF